ncbi:hypothetical protein [Limnohabitans sp. TEGF004]|uniref:hypothetical protein n=1 Tax=Limnohabitans sp. TEGF004 TaxID=2986281 RepID=UPI002377CFA8|nr:hypothetical protein [Limnohabitans sp. TEGF004]BDU55985.1 hypothetical protein LTEGF4_16660 [Limnohabitans sp. TEGF004]
MSNSNTIGGRLFNIPSPVETFGAFPVSYRVERDVQAQTITVTPWRINPESHEKEYGSRPFVFDPTAIKSHIDLGKHWGIHTNWALESRFGWEDLGYLHSVFPQTNLHKNPFLLGRPLHPRVVLFFVPFEESSIEEVAVLVYSPQSMPPEGFSEFVEVRSRVSLYNAVLPSIELEVGSSCSAGESLPCVARLIQPAYETNDMPAIETRSGVLYLECEAGFLPKTKVPIVNGVANFNWVALGLNSGDVGLVKVGFKYFSHKTSASVEVV